MRRVLCILMSTGLVLALALAVGAVDEPVYGGTAVVASHSSPDTLDLHVTTARAAQVNAGIYIFEGLAGFDEGSSVRPMLAKRWEFNEDLTVCTFYLREGVLFHDGSSFDAEDVLASIARWREISPGADRLGIVTSITAPDPYTVVFECSEPFGTLPETLCSEGYNVAIFPSEIASQMPAAGQIDIIGTGPYKLVNWIPGTEIVMERFEDYVADDRPASGFVGFKGAYLDRIIWKQVPEEEIRFAGLLTGDFSIAQPLPGDYVDRILAAESQGIELRTFTDMKPYVFLSVQPDSPLADARMRQALRLAIDHDEVMYAATTSEARYFVNLDMLQFQSQTCWDPTIMAGVLDKADVAGAKALAAEAGYAGEPITFLASIKSFHHRRPALELSEQWKAAGFNIELQLKDWAVVIATLPEFDKWDIWYARQTFFNYGHYAGIGNGGYDSPVFQEILTEMRTNTDPEALCDILVRLREEVLIPDVPIINYGDMFGVGAQVANLKGVGNAVQSGYYSYLANAWFENE
jgi:peptide/nickel transport system substrate-binding protein